MTETDYDAVQGWASADHRPRVGLALGGGGARGLAHIGVLRALERAGIPIDCLAGTSMGGVMAAGYASGMSPADLEREAKAATRLIRLLSLAGPGLPDGGLLHGRRLLAYFERQMRRCSFSDLRLPLALVAVDLNTHREAVLRDGPVALALRATTSIPVLFAPVELNGQRLVDGGLLNNVPTDVAREMGAELVIAVDVASTPETSAFRWVGDLRLVPASLKRALEMFDDIASTLALAATERKLRDSPPDVLIRPTIPPGVNTLEGYHRLAELVACGECAAEACLPEIREAIFTGSGHAV